MVIAPHNDNVNLTEKMWRNISWHEKSCNEVRCEQRARTYSITQLQTINWVKWRETITTSNYMCITQERIMKFYQRNDLFLFRKIFHKNRTLVWSLDYLICRSHHHQFLTLHNRKQARKSSPKKQFIIKQQNTKRQHRQQNHLFYS